MGLKKFLATVSLAGLVLGSAACGTVDRFVLTNGFSCETYSRQQKVIIYKDNKEVGVVDFEKQKIRGVVDIEITGSGSEKERLLYNFKYLECREKYLEKYLNKGD